MSSLAGATAADRSTGSDYDALLGAAYAYDTLMTMYPTLTMQPTIAAGTRMQHQVENLAAPCRLS